MTPQGTAESAQSRIYGTSLAEEPTVGVSFGVTLSEPCVFAIAGVVVIVVVCLLLCSSTCTCALTSSRKRRRYSDGANGRAQTVDARAANDEARAAEPSRGARTSPQYVDPPRPIDAPPTEKVRAVVLPTRFEPPLARAARANGARLGSPASADGKRRVASAPASGVAAVRLRAAVTVLAASNFADTGVNRSAVRDVAERFKVTPRSVVNWVERLVAGDTLERRRGSGRRHSTFDDVNEALHDIFDTVMTRDLSTRALTALVNEALLDDGKSSVSRSTVQRVLREGFELVREQVKPPLSSEHRARRVVFCSQEYMRMLDDQLSGAKASVWDLHVDEKVFVAFNARRRVYVPKAIAAKLAEGGNVLNIKRPSKKKIDAIPVIAFVGLPIVVDDDVYFDGKLAAGGVCEWKVATNNRGFRKTGEPYADFNRQMDAQWFKENFLGKLFFDAWAVLAAKVPWVRKWRLQMDGAGAHGIGNAKDRGAARANEYGEYLNEKARGVLGRRAPTIEIIVQPSKSPDLNLLDIGVWRSLAAGYQVVRPPLGERTMSIHGQMLDEVLRHWRAMDGVRVLTGVGQALRSTLTSIVDSGGKNDFRIAHSATFSLLSRRDVIIVASVSCIFGIGSAEAYYGMVAPITEGEELDRDVLLRRLVAMHYERNDIDFHRGTFRVRGDVVEVFPAYEDDKAVRIEFFGDEVEAIREMDPLRGTSRGSMKRVTIFPASHYVTPASKMREAIEGIKTELGQRLPELREDMKLVEAQRLEQRCMFDIEMLEQMGRCSGIENYSRHLSGRAPGEPPPTLLDYFADDFMLVVDESHATMPQVRAMYRGDRARKTTLVEHGFRLPSALDNRPLQFPEFEERIAQAVFVSATPGDYELQRTEGVVVEQLIRPTWLLDPEIEIRPIAGQVDDLLDEIRARIDKDERVLVTTLTKRMAEDLTEYYADLGLRVRYLHSDVDTLERVEIIRDLRLGEFDVLIGINLLREGLDLPEVSLVAILDADKEGFLRSERSLMQTCGRAARNLNGRVIMYADRTTDSMRKALDETERRRALQAAYNQEHGVTPRSTRAKISPIEQDKPAPGAARGKGRGKGSKARELPVGLDRAGDQDLLPRELGERIRELEQEMRALAKDLRYEEAARLRDRIRVLEVRKLEFG